MLFIFTSPCAISSMKFNSPCDKLYWIQPHVIKFIPYFQKVSSILRANIIYNLWRKLTSTILLKYVLNWRWNQRWYRCHVGETSSLESKLLVQKVPRELKSKTSFKFKNWRKNQDIILHSETNKTIILRIIKGHNSRTMKVRHRKIKLICIVVI